MKKFTDRLLLLAIVAAFTSDLALAQTKPANSDEIVVATIDFPPFGIHKDGMATGAAVQVLREISKRKKIPAKEILIPITRVDEIAEKMPALFPIMTRSKKREEQLKWVGKLTDDAYCFLTLKKNPPITSMDQARKLKAIATNKGGSSEDALAKNGGFSNFDGSAGNTVGVRKLFAGRVDAVWTTRTAYAYAVKSEGKNPDDVVCTGEYNKHEYWIAATKQLPEKTFEEYKASFAELEKEGFLKKAIESF